VITINIQHADMYIFIRNTIQTLDIAKIEYITNECAPFIYWTKIIRDTFISKQILYTYIWFKYYSSKVEVYYKNI
jgi:hypothetical protein